MAERLTDKNTVSVYNNSNSEIYLGKGEEATKYICKLAQLEDIMEKYGIESVEELDKRLQNLFELTCGRKNGKTIARKIILFDKMKQDRDTWKMACELACDSMTKLGGDDCCGCRLNKEMCNICDNKKGLIDYFYQQAKKEKENETK